jgi:broad specificity phosphatase PhoE
VTSTARRPLELLLVRHGTTPTTGKVLPGRAPGLHLAELGQAQAEAVAARLVAATPPVTKNKEQLKEK